MGTQTVLPGEAPPTARAPGAAVVVNWWARVWPALLAVTVVGSVGTPAAVASYRHARDVVVSTGDVVMAPWLPLSVDGMLLAALVVMWVRRHRGEKVGKGPWAAFIFGMVVTVGANLEAVNIHPTPLGPPGGTDYVVALFPPLALAIALELVALVAKRTAPAAAVPENVPAVPVPAVPARVPENVPARVPVPVLAAVPVPVPAVPENIPAAVPENVPAVVPENVPDPVPAVPAAEQREHDENAGTDDENTTDDEIVVWLRERAEEDRVVPGVRAIRARFPVGATRASRLRKTVSVPRRIRSVK